MDVRVISLRQRMRTAEHSTAFGRIRRASLRVFSAMACFLPPTTMRGALFPPRYLPAGIQPPLNSVWNMFSSYRLDYCLFTLRRVCVRIATFVARSIAGDYTHNAVRVAFCLRLFDCCSVAVSPTAVSLRFAVRLLCRVVCVNI